MIAPDKNLGQYIMKKTGREMKLWMGSCFVHETFSGRKITNLKLEHPDAKLIAHPECEEVILKEAEFIGSTSSLLNHVKTDPAKKFIVATEPGIIYQMQKAAPDKTFIPAPPEASCACNECPYMKLNTLEKLYLCMRDRKPEIIMDEDLIVRAYKPIKRMLEMSK